MFSEVANTSTDHNGLLRHLSRELTDLEVRGTWALAGACFTRKCAIDSRTAREPDFVGPGETSLRALPFLMYAQQLTTVIHRGIPPGIAPRRGRARTVL
jgi:hypothetical protein